MWRSDEPHVYLNGADRAHLEQLQAQALDVIRQDRPFLLVHFDDDVENLELIASTRTGLLGQALRGAALTMLDLADHIQERARG